MVSTLLQNQGGGNAATWIILVVLLAILVVMYIFSAIRRKKYNQEVVAMLDALKPGDKIKTYSGIYGTIVSIRETTDGKVVTLETGDEKHKSYTTVDASVIYCLDKKQDVVYDAEGNIVEPADETTETAEKVDVVEVVADEDKAEEGVEASDADDFERPEIKEGDYPADVVAEDESKAKKTRTRKSTKE